MILRRKEVDEMEKNTDKIVICVKIHLVPGNFLLNDVDCLDRKSVV